MQWSPQQAQALRSIKAWVHSPKGAQVMRVFGFAGSGKTTLAREIENMVSGTVLYMSFTGKAALVLRKKGCAGASTIHSAIYKPDEDDDGEVVFVLSPDSAVAYASVVVVDEVSMVGEELGRDLLSYGTKVLVLGDPFQLPPVKGTGFFTSAEPDVMLTEVHRQAADNPIIRMSMDIREGRGLLAGRYGESAVVRRSDIPREDLGTACMDADQVICGLNKTRQGLNNRMREILGYGPRPERNDKLVCLKNDKELGLLNGGLWQVNGTHRVPADRGVEIIGLGVSSMDFTADQDVEVPAAFFSGKEEELDFKLRRDYSEFTYGYALTCHKSQGSQWDNVVVFDESAPFRADRQRWLYTAVTRAAERVTVVA